jgi:hypothetical protein
LGLVDGTNLLVHNYLLMADALATIYALIMVHESTAERSDRQTCDEDILTYVKPRSSVRNRQTSTKAQDRQLKWTLASEVGYHTGHRVTGPATGNPGRA